MRKFADSPYDAWLTDREESLTPCITETGRVACNILIEKTPHIASAESRQLPAILPTPCIGVNGELTSINECLREFEAKIEKVSAIV